MKRHPSKNKNPFLGFLQKIYSFLMTPFFYFFKPNKNQFTTNVGGSVERLVNIGQANNVYINKSKISVENYYQLRLPPNDFTGRQEEIKELMSKILDEGIPLINIDGMGGVGKTTLALALADKLVTNYPDGQLFVEMRGLDTTPLSPSDAMTQMIRAYDPNFQLPERPSEQDKVNEIGNLYRSTFRKKKVLIFLDNAANAKQVEELILPKNCLLLITSRQKFYLPGLYQKQLQTLPIEAAKELLIKICPRIANYSTDLASLCGCLPLVLRLAASALFIKKDLSVSEYIQRLTNVRERLDLIEASVNLSYELLSKTYQDFWSFLSIFPAGFYKVSTKAIWEDNQEDSKDALTDLVSFNMVEWDPNTNKYHLHDLLKIVAASKLSQEKTGEYQKQHANHFGSLLINLTDLYEKGNNNILTALDIFDASWDSIRAGQAWAASNYATDDLAAQLCTRYANAPHILLLRLRPEEYISWLEIAIQAAKRLNNREAEASHLVHLGNAYQKLKRRRAAKICLESALQIFTSLNLQDGTAVVLGSLGQLSFSLKLYGDAINFHTQALQIHRRLNDKRGQASELGSLAAIYEEINQLEKALSYNNDYLSICKELGDFPSASIAHNNLAMTLEKVSHNMRLNGNLVKFIKIKKQAISHYKLAIKTAEMCNDKKNQANPLGNLSFALNDIGNKQESIKYAKLAFKIYSEFGDSQARKMRDHIVKLGGTI